MNIFEPIQYCLQKIHKEQFEMRPAFPIWHEKLNEMNGTFSVSMSELGWL